MFMKIMQRFDWHRNGIHLLREIRWPDPETKENNAINMIQITTATTLLPSKMEKKNA